MNAIGLLAFSLAGICLMTGVFLQSRAIVKQKKPWPGIALKFGAILTLFALTYFFRDGILLSLAFFCGSAFCTLLTLTLASRAPLR